MPKMFISLGCPQILSVAECGLLTLPFPPPECWDHEYMLPHPIHAFLCFENMLLLTSFAKIHQIKDLVLSLLTHYFPFTVYLARFPRHYIILQGTLTKATSPIPRTPSQIAKYHKKPVQLRGKRSHPVPIPVTSLLASHARSGHSQQPSPGAPSSIIPQRVT